MIIRSITLPFDPVSNRPYVSRDPAGIPIFSGTLFELPAGESEGQTEISRVETHRFKEIPQEFPGMTPIPAFSEQSPVKARMIHLPGSINSSAVEQETVNTSADQGNESTPLENSCSGDLRIFPWNQPAYTSEARKASTVFPRELVLQERLKPAAAAETCPYSLMQERVFQTAKIGNPPAANIEHTPHLSFGNRVRMGGGEAANRQVRIQRNGIQPEAAFREFISNAQHSEFRLDASNTYNKFSLHERFLQKGMVKSTESDQSASRSHVSESDATTRSSPAKARALSKSAVRHAKIMLRNGRSSATIFLEPPSLGKLKLEIVTVNTKVLGKIFVESKEAMDIIRSNLSELHRNLMQNGLQVESFDIQAGHHDGMDGRAHWGSMESADSLLQSGEDRAGEIVADMGVSFYQRGINDGCISQYIDVWI